MREFECLTSFYGLYRKCTTKRLTYRGFIPNDITVQRRNFEGWDNFNCQPINTT